MASKKPRPALRVNVTKQIRTIFTWVRSRKNESFEGSASERTETAHSYNRRKKELDFIEMAENEHII